MVISKDRAERSFRTTSWGTNTSPDDPRRRSAGTTRHQVQVLLGRSQHTRTATAPRACPNQLWRRGIGIYGQGLMNFVYCFVSANGSPAISFHKGESDSG